MVFFFLIFMAGAALLVDYLKVRSEKTIRSEYELNRARVNHLAV